MFRISLFLTLILLSFLNSASSQPTCHYTCQSCEGTQYYQCLTCPENRGDALNKPIAGMCYCTGETDQNNDGVCTGNYQFNRNNKSIISVFIGLAIGLSLIGSLISGHRHFLIKTIEDVQEISIIVLINLYFPQQFDIFLTSLYRFNISSATFQNLTSGSLFILQQNEVITSTDGQNLFGKYKLLYKTANFFANQFTWLIVFVTLALIALILRFVRNRLRACEAQNSVKNENRALAQCTLNDDANLSKNDIFATQQDFNDINRSSVSIDGQGKKQSKQSKGSAYKIINKVYNFFWLNLFITFFYLSLIEININVFTQISNLTFSSGFAAVGTFFSAFFLAIQLIVLSLLALKTREQTIKPEWMRDYTYTAPIYFIRTNYKTVTKYFWFGCCIKKILLAIMVTTLYYSPESSILGICSVQIVFVCFVVYCEPFQRRYLRIHYYSIEGMKLFLYVCLVNFTEQYVEYARMIQLTKILYFMLAFIFGFNFFYILLNIIAERDTYVRAWIQRFYPSSQSSYLDGKIGYHSEGKMFIYEKQ